MKLKEYQTWIDEVRDYWTNEINNCSECTDEQKTEALNILNQKLQEFNNAVQSYISRFPEKRFKHALLAYFAAYKTYKCTNIQEKYPEFTEPSLGKLTDYISYYSFDLPSDYSTLFTLNPSAGSGSDGSGEEGESSFFTTEGIDNLIKQINNLDDDSNLKQVLSTVSDNLIEVGVSNTVRIAEDMDVLVFESKEPNISFDEYCQYKVVCRDFNIQIKTI
jgi:hypothetical protein